MMHLAYEILLLCSILYGFVFIETSSFLQHLLNTQQQSQIRSIYELQRCQSELRDDMSCVLDMGYGRIHRGKMKMRMSSADTKVSNTAYKGNARTIADLEDMSVKEALKEIAGHFNALPSVEIVSNSDVVKAAPTVCKYIIANPKAFFENEEIAKHHGVDLESFPPSTPLVDLAEHLPVLYIADVHSEYGTLGFLLNRPTGLTLGDDQFHPEFRAFRNRRVYLGGVQNRGSSFTMIHQKTGFPENRKWKGVPGDNEFKLFFSPDIAMANELCMTDDAKVEDFKFFHWATVWSPKQLDLEYKQKLWLTIQAPVSLIFEDSEAMEVPLWRRIVASFPPERLG